MQTLPSVKPAPGRRVWLDRPAWLPERVWPFETFGLETADAVMAVTDVGQGPALLLAHVGAWSFLWRDVMLRLARDFRCVCFDAPGTGRSTQPGAGGVGLEKASRAIRAVIEQLGLQAFGLVVHDLGGPAALDAVAGDPGKVRGIAAINAFGWRPSGAGLRGMLALMGSSVVCELDARTGWLPRLTSTAFGVGRNMDEASRSAFRLGMNPRAFHEYMRDARHCDALYERAGRALADVPLLTIFGERNDPFHFQQSWKALFPAARQVVVRGGNHFPMCDDPALVERELRAWMNGIFAGHGWTAE